MEMKTAVRRKSDKHKMSQFSRRHFQDIDIKELIHHYKQYECLWNFNSPDYKNKTAKYDAWLNIANHFHKNVIEVKRKIKYLRSAYVAEKKKVDASKKSGTASPYKPSLFYYNEMDFLDNIVVWRKSGNEQDGTDIEFENIHIAPDIEDEEEMMSLTFPENPQLKQPEVTCKTETFPELSNSPPLTPAPEIPIKTSPKILSTTSISSRTHKRLRRGLSHTKSSNNTVQNKSSQLSNLYTSFGRTIALQLQQLPLDIAIMTMSEIHTMITQKTLEYIRCKQNDNETWSNSESENSFSELVDETLDDTY